MAQSSFARLDDSLPTPPDSTPSTGSKIRNLADVAKLKTKKALHIEYSHDDDEQTRDEAAIAELSESPAFNSSKVLNTKDPGADNKARAFLQATKQVIAHPTSAMKTRTTKKTAGKLAKSRPFLSKKADLDFLEAYDQLQAAKESRSAKDDDEAVKARLDDVDICEDRIERMEREREAMKVAWVTSRHVQRARVVKANPLSFPSMEHFEQPDDCGVPEFEMGKWIAMKLLHTSRGFTAQYIDDFDELPYDSDSLRRLVERFIMVSAPVQTFFSDVRSVYTWKDPARTGKWMLLYMILWYTSQVVAFVWASAIYICLKNYYYPMHLEELRIGVERSLDRGATAQKIGELMDRHGSDDWLEPLLDELGPYVQVQIHDFTNILEIAYNFFHWCDPSATRNTLCLSLAFLTLTVFGGSYFNLRLFWLCAGFCFFACWPISALYPKYRLLVSPYRIAFWDVPTDAEWCFRYLNDRASVARRALLSVEDNANSDVIHAADDESDYSERSFDTSDGSMPRHGKDVLSFACTYSNIPGHFVISTSGLRFEGALGVLISKSFDKKYTELVEISKRQSGTSMLSPLAKFTGVDKMELRFRGANLQSMSETESSEIVLLENMKGRDKAFNAVVGFSGLRWQCLQKRPDRDKKPTK